MLSVEMFVHSHSHVSILIIPVASFGLLMWLLLPSLDAGMKFRKRCVVEINNRNTRHPIYICQLVRIHLKYQIRRRLQQLKKARSVVVDLCLLILYKMRLESWVLYLDLRCWKTQRSPCKMGLWICCNHSIYITWKWGI
ncbi:hypothetical protein Ccrd_011795, partial [Cynara cardunculus var. scolymus]